MGSKGNFKGKKWVCLSTHQNEHLNLVTYLSNKWNFYEIKFTMITCPIKKLVVMYKVKSIVHSVNWIPFTKQRVIALLKILLE